MPAHSRLPLALLPFPPSPLTSSSAKATASKTIFLPSVGDWQAKVMCTTPLSVFWGSWVRSRWISGGREGGREGGEGKEEWGMCKD